MIVFWRLLLALFLTDFVFLSWDTSHAKKTKRVKWVLARSALFTGLAFLLCQGYLSEGWPFIAEWTVPGWMCVCAFAVFYGAVSCWAILSEKRKGAYTLTFFLQHLLNILFLVLIAPFRVLYETGNFFAEDWVIFLVGLVVATRIVGAFIFALERDLYGRDYPTWDEQWLLALVRAIFFLIMLLPGLRWAVVLAVWFGACLYARRIRLLDVPGWAFYIGAFGAAFIGLLVRLRFYLVG